MKYRVYNDQDWCERTKRYYPTYFKTKREAMVYAEKIGHNAVVERQIVKGTCGWLTKIL